ncbi:MAG: DUF751 family protein [Cyanobacteria bacterium]|nr:DUF751 family protein [Cyanobacteriota bacterium]MDW8200124.1 DUF751 family protein [Cyanobacteriota bacterium SKYGB_h_bin112]
MADFFKNVGRYCSYFITITLGVLYVFFQRFVPLFQRPVSAIAVISLLVSSLIFIGFTLRAMLGLNTA